MINIFLFSLFSYSQIRESGTVQGQVVDDQKIPLIGANVTITGSKLIGGPRSVITGAKGFYKFPVLLPGEYTVKAELMGFNTLVKEGIRIHAGVTLTVDFELKIATLKNEVTVKASAPMIDVMSPKTSGVIMTNELINSLPINRKYFDEIMNMAPGFVQGTAYAQANASVYHNSLQVDGVEVLPANTGNPYQFFPDFNIIEEVNVEALGLPAEYGEYTGAVVTMTTKSGGNKFSTLNEMRYNGDDWNSQNYQKVALEDWANPFTKPPRVFTQTILSFGSQAGYKILKDKLWFFVSGEYVNSKNTAQQTTGFLSRSSLSKGFLKLTFQLNPSNKIDGSTILSYSYSNAPLGLAGGANVEIDPEIGADTINPTYYLNLNWTSILSRTAYLEVKLGYNNINNNSEPRKGRDVPSHEDLLLKTLTGNWPTYSARSDRSFQLRAHLSKSISEFLGSHDVKLGAELTSNQVLQVSGYSGGARFEDSNGIPYRKYEKSESRQDRYFKNIVGFLQDSWGVSKRLTLSLGLRLNNYQGKIPAPDRGVVFQAMTLSPRLGATFDLFGDRKTVLKFHYGLYAEPLYGAVYGLLESRYYDENVYEWNGTQYALIYSQTTKPSWADLYTIDPDLKQPFIHEITGGIQRELFQNASLSLSFYYRTLGQSFGAIDIGSEWANITVSNPGPDGIPGTDDDRGTFEAYDVVELGKQFYYITNPKKGMCDLLIDEPRWNIKGIEVVFSKRFSKRWQVMASYNFSITRGNTGSSLFQPTSPNALITPYGEGRLGMNYPNHMAKLAGNFLLPIDINLGLIGTWHSGYPALTQFAYSLPVSGAYYFNGGKMGEFETDRTLLFSARLEKIFMVFGGKLTYTLDVNNVFNTYLPAGRGYVFGPYFQKIRSLQTPRTFRISIRFQFG